MGSNTSYTDYPAEARTGRENQVYDDSNVRQVTGFFF